MQNCKYIMLVSGSVEMRINCSSFNSEGVCLYDVAEQQTAAGEEASSKNQPIIGPTEDSAH